MLIELLMKKNGKLLFFVFLILFLIATSFGVIFVVNNLNTTIKTFEKDGYALYLNGDKNSKAIAYSFEKGTDYKYQKLIDSISFQSDEKNIKVDDETVIHYSDGSLGVFKKVVGIDVSKINNDIIFYYNIYKDTKIDYSDNSYNIKLSNGDLVNFENLLIRVSDNKFVLTGENVRLVLENDEIVDFGNYVEFEYTNGNVVKIYNNEKYYQTISSDAVILVSDVKINLKEATVYKDNVAYIALTNLVINHDSNIDTLEEEVKKLEVSDPDVDVNIDGNNSSSTGGSIQGGNIDNSVDNSEEDDEVIVDDNEDKSTPTYKVTELILTALKIDAKIEITDDDALISSDTTVKIIENATSKVIYEETSPQGDSTILISTAGLSPDTEYTITATANYKKDEIEYTKTFVSKIFRTEALGVSFEKNYATENSLEIEIVKENYSKVESLVLQLYDTDGNLIQYKPITFDEESIQEISFEELTSDTEYIVKMTEILSQGVIVEDGFSQKSNYKTLKKKPEIGELTYEIDKKNQQFNLNVSSMIDENYGIKSFKYEVYDARDDIMDQEPILTIEQDELAQVSINVDDIKIYRGIAYTYVLVVEFYDNEKIIEYSKELGETMTLDGVEFPTIRWDEATSYVTWEQINGTIIIEDPSSAIMSDRYQIVYKNSIDVYVSTTITADSETGNIPININGLRANETYTFQVYGSVNLQDGNVTEDSVYLGSIFVQTKKPNALIAEYNILNDYNSAFSIDFRLKDDENTDSSLEAKTLTEITFTIYEGSTTDGAKAVYKRVLDTNSEPYISTLKNDFYDASAIIDPEFFKSKNSDFTEDVYTLEISRAYDYTDYKNEIPIKNNTISFKLGTYLPEMPEDENDAVLVTTITNNVAESFGLEYDSNLDGNTIVAYNLLPKFNNEFKNTKYIEWKVYKYNSITQEYEYLEGQDKTTYFDENGTIEPTTYMIEQGTENSVNDIDALRRGNNYYFTYKLYLDADSDGETDIIYPDSVEPDLVLRSITISPLKQEAQILMYPSISTQNTYTWKYKIKDIDFSLEENKLYSQMEGSTAYTSTPNVEINQESFNTVTFTGLSGNKALIIKKKQRTLKSNEPEYVTLTQEFFHNQISNLNLSYSVIVDVNKLVILMDDYYNNIDLINNITMADVTITPVNQDDLNRLGQQTISGVELDNDRIAIEFIDISKYLTIDIRVDVTVYYDSGKMGFDLESEYIALQRVSIDSSRNYYGYNKNSNTLILNSTIKNSMFKSFLDIDSSNLQLITLNEVVFNLPITIDATGVIYNDTNVVPKELKKQQINSNNKTVQFDLIIPGISLVDSSNKNDITALLDSAEINAKIITADTIDIKDELIYLELYETDENGTSAQYVRTESYNISEFSSKLIIDGLLPETNYYIQFYSYVYNNETNAYEKFYLYDIDQQVTGCKYNFYTLSKVEITNLSATMLESSYGNKTLEIKYNLDTLSGYDHISYKLQKLENGVYVDTNIEIPNSTVVFENMTLNINANPNVNSEILYGESYQLTISPIGYYNKDGESYEVDLGTINYQFTIEDAQHPYIGISSSKNADNLFFRVSISDPDYVIPNGVYEAKLVDSNYTTVAIFESQSIDMINKLFTFNKSVYNLVDNEEYTFVVTIRTDLKNNKTNLVISSENKTEVAGDTISLGTVTAVKNTGNSKYIDIVFSESYKLDTVDTIQYTINGGSTGFYLSNKEDFIIRYDSEKNLYTFTITITDSESFIIENMYTIGINFYTGNKLVEQTELSYYYTE